MSQPNEPTKSAINKDADKTAKMVEPTGDAYLDEFIIPKIICSIEETLEEVPKEKIVEETIEKEEEKGSFLSDSDFLIQE